MVSPMFQVIAIISFLLLATTGLYHRIKAARSGDPISRKEEGVPVMILLRLFGFSMWLGVWIYMINPAWMSWSALELPLWVRWTGVGMVILAIPLIHWMFSSLGKNATDTVAIRERHSLVTHGPYRYVRHPMYSLSFLYFIGYSLLAANWFIGTTGLIALVMLMVRTPVEEAKLEEAFGDEYRMYASRTARFIPGVV